MPRKHAQRGAAEHGSTVGFPKAVEIFTQQKAQVPSARRLPRDTVPFTASKPFSTFWRIKVINLIVWLVVGGVIGWLASLIMKTDGQQGVILNVVVGIAGAALGGLVISPLVGMGTINDDAFNIGALVVSLIGAVILLGIVNMFRRGSVR